MIKPADDNFVFPTPLAIQPEEVELLTPADRRTVSEWATARRKLSPKTTHLAGDWSNDYAPWGVEIMDSLSDPGIRQVTEKKPAQGGGSERANNFKGWIIEEAPGPLLEVMPTEKDTARRVNTRTRTMFESTPTLRKHLPGGDLDAINIGKETLLDNMIMYLGWAGSAAALADNPICYVILDEVGKYPARTKKEADPVSLAKERMRTFYTRSKLYCLSTPVVSSDLIDREFNLGDKREWWIKCTHCGDYHIPAWGNVKLDKDETGGLLSKDDYESGGHSRYVCPECGVLWTEMERWMAVVAGRWCPDGCTVEPSGRIAGVIPITTHRSYHISALILYPGFMTVDRLAGMWAEAIDAKKSGDIGPLQNFINSQLGEVWEEAEKETDEKKLSIHKGTYSFGTIPDGVQLLTCGADIQLDHVWAAVLGWGYLSECWLIDVVRLETGDTGNIENLQLLRSYLRSEFLTADGRKFFIRKSAIDSGYRPDPILDLCRQATELDVIPVRGDDSVRTRVFRAVKNPGTPVIRYDLNVNVIKDRLYRLMYESDQPGPGYYHLPQDCDEDTLEQLASEEQRIERHGRRQRIIWAKKSAGRANHIWDCNVYAAFAAELAGARMLADPEISVATARRTIRKGGGFLDDLPSL